MDTVQTTQDAPAFDAPELTTATDGWDLDRKIEARDAILELAKQAGWPVLFEAIELRKAELHDQLTHRVKPMETPAQYESILGEIRGLESIKGLTNGVILNGDNAQREREEEQSNGGI